MKLHANLDAGVLCFQAEGDDELPILEALIQVHDQGGTLEVYDLRGVGTAFDIAGNQITLKLLPGGKQP